MKLKFLFASSLLLLIISQSSAQEFHDPLFGENVFIFDDGMKMHDIQTALDTIFRRQTVRGSEFSKNRFAVLFKPGNYHLDVKVDYYMTIHGLGASPEDVIINGPVRSNTTHGKSVLTNFWRSVENLAVNPDSEVVWGVSQAAPMRRVHIKGNLQLFDIGYASGGFLADSKVDGNITSGPQQQWFSRNCEIGKWIGGNWNMMFVGVKGAPAADFPNNPYTTIESAPLIREKPFIIYREGKYFVRVPASETNSSGISWNRNLSFRDVPIEQFYLAKPGDDNSDSMNEALGKGKNLLITPGIYSLDESLKVTKKGTIVMGIGMPSLKPLYGTPAIEVSDVDAITVCGLTVDAGPETSGALFVMGEEGSGRQHKKDPSFLFDVFFRVGGPSEGSAEKCMVINSNNVHIDHTWIWRADHGNGVGWDRNRCASGLVVNGDDVTIYGLFNEHFQEYQTLWNGERGRLYFYQSEMPYDPPTVDSWKHDGTYGYASYKVADNVKDHEAWGLGIYNVFYDAPVIVDNAIETPPSLENKIHNKIIFWLNGNKESYVKSIINGKGGRVDVNNRKATMK